MTDLRPLGRLSPAISTRHAAPGPAHVAILLASYNGAATLAEQLDSIAAQTHEDWSLIVSDDGSRDGTPGLVRAFAAEHPGRRVTLLRGPGRGSAQNFLSLLRAAGAAPFVAFADQDDRWFPAKLARALAALDGLSGPALYGSRTMIADADLRPLRLSPEFRRAPGFANALVQNIAGGNTMVLNRRALDMLQPASLRATRIVAHDWWCYQMVTGAGGRMVYDPRPSLLYRQHGANQIGANDTALASLARFRGLMQGRLAGWLDAHGQALHAARDWLTPDTKAILDARTALRGKGPIGRLRALLDTGLYRQTRRGTAALWLAAALGRL